MVDKNVAKFVVGLGTISLVLFLTIVLNEIFLTVFGILGLIFTLVGVLTLIDYTIGD